MISLIEEEGDSFAQIGEISHQKKPQLVKMVQQLHSSFLSLAQKFDQRRAESPPAIPHLSSSSSSNSLKQLLDAETATSKSEGTSNPKSEPNSDPESAVEDPETEIIMMEKRGAIKSCNERVEIVDKIDELGLMRDSVREDLGSHASLLEDLLRQQEELIRRNDEKRVSIRELHLQLDRLSEQNRVLENCLSRNSIRRDPSRLKRLLSWKFW